MLNEGHLDLNSVQFCSDSLKDRLKQTMLNHEFVYMGQVFELHRLYRIQTAMAEDIKQRGLDTYNSHVRGVNSNPVNLNNQVKCPMSDIQSSTPGFKQKPLDLQLSADDFIRQSSNAAIRGSPFNLMNKDVVTLDLSLSLNIGEEPNKEGGEHRSLVGKRACPPQPDFIDLEDPNSKFSNYDSGFVLPSGLSTPNPSFKDNHMLERSIIIDKRNLQSFSKSGIRHVSQGTTSSTPFINVDRTYRRQALCESGFNGNVVASNTSIPRRAVMLDLNTFQLEDLSDFSNPRSGVVNSVATVFSTVTEKVNNSESIFLSSVIPTAFSTLAEKVNSESRRESNVNNCAEIPDIHEQNNLKLGNKISRGSKSEDSKGKTIFIDLVSDSDKELSSGGPHPKIESVGSSSHLSNGLSCEFEMGEAGGAEAGIEKDPEPFCQNLSVTEQSSDQKLSNSSEIERVIDIQACSIKTMQSGVNGGDSNLSSSDHSQVVDLGPEQRSSENPDLNTLCFKSNELEMDEIEQKAAELLVQISKVSQRKEPDSPQCSLDSYEAMVLDSKECGPDDYCISSNAFVVDVSEKKDSRYKLKRGTRMKDFQKDILSSLSTLSRHEIREDINIFEGVIRSREYKKMRAKMADGEGDWCMPKKNKRSRISRR